VRFSRGRATGCVLVLGVVLLACIIPDLLIWAFGVGGALVLLHMLTRNYAPSPEAGSPAVKYNA